MEGHDLIFHIGPFPSATNTGGWTTNLPQDKLIKLHPGHCSIGSKSWKDLHFRPVMQKLLLQLNQHPVKRRNTSTRVELQIAPVFILSCFMLDRSHWRWQLERPTRQIFWCPRPCEILDQIKRIPPTRRLRHRWSWHVAIRLSGVDAAWQRPILQPILLQLHWLHCSVLNEPVGSQSARSRAYAVSHSQNNSTSQSEILANWLGLHPDCVIYMVLSLVMAGLKLPEKGRRGGLPAVLTRQDLALFSSLRVSQQPPPLYSPTSSRTLN